MPFCANEEEQQEIRNCAKIFFYGGNPNADSETKSEWQKWQSWFDIFVLCVDARYGNFLRLPFNCDLWEMPKKSISVMFLLQNLYREKLADDMQKSSSKIKPFRR